MFVVTLSKTSLKKLGAGAACCALVVFSAMLGRFISTRTVAVAAPVNRIESAQDIQTWFTGYGLEVDGASITADKVKIPRKWDDSFSAFNGVVQQSGMDLARYKGKTVEKWSALLPAASSGETSRYGVLLVYKKKAVGAYLLEKPSGTVLGLQDAQNELAKQTSGEDYSGDWGERHDEQLTDSTALHRAAAGRRRVPRGIGAAFGGKTTFFKLLSGSCTNCLVFTNDSTKIRQNTDFCSIRMFKYNKKFL